MEARWRRRSIGMDGDAIESIVVGARRRGAFERAHADAVPYGEER